MGTPNRGPKEYNRNMIEYKDSGGHISHIIFLLYSWGSLFVVPSNVPLLVSGVGLEFREVMGLGLATYHKFKRAHPGL